MTGGVALMLVPLPRLSLGSKVQLRARTWCLGLKRVNLQVLQGCHCPPRPPPSRQTASRRAARPLSAADSCTSADKLHTNAGLSN